MDDRQLLELAAKAAGIEIGYDEFRGEFRFKMEMGFLGDKWDPLNNDGDLFRLAAIVLGRIDYVIVEWNDDETGRVRRSVDLPATRRATVKAAAAIGATL